MNACVVEHTRVYKEVNMQANSSAGAQTDHKSAVVFQWDQNSSNDAPDLESDILASKGGCWHLSHSSPPHSFS